MTLRSALLDLRPLAVADFRRLWIGTGLTQFGAQMTTVAVLVQVWAATGSTIWTGAIGIAHALPMVLVGLIGGALADHVDRRRLVLVATTGSFGCSILLVWQGFSGGLDPLLLLVLVAVQTGFTALGGPARRTFVPRLLPPHLVSAGIALSTVTFQAAMLVGPSVAGLIAGSGGVGWCYLVDAVTFAAAFYGVLRLPSIRADRVEDTGGRTRPGLGTVAEGLRYVVRHRLVRAAFLTDLAATVLAMPVSLFPAVNAQRFGGSPQTLGLFLTAIAVGGMACSAVSGLYTGSARPGRTMLAGAAVWGLALAAFGLVSDPWTALGCLVIAGGADTVSVVARSTLVQLATPDSYRGRVSAAEQIIGVSGPDVGNVRAGAVAAVSSPGFALTSGGMLALAGVLAVAVRVRGLRTFRLDHPAGGERPTAD